MSKFVISCEAFRCVKEPIGYCEECRASLCGTHLLLASVDGKNKHLCESCARKLGAK
jgi:hypothetical protein